MKPDLPIFSLIHHCARIIQTPHKFAGRLYSYRGHTKSTISEVFTFTPHDGEKHVQESVAQSMGSEKFSDVIFKVENTVFFAHKVVSSC